ncbi:TonB-dependent receptor domain-containing protein [Kaistia terrae]|uniref:TonB-dependent receptor domain-containing protein n=1 Tax=Kaistia terrae TaxID=537017 RepID=A0ABW0PYY2_9HYPH|nr:TonB-dependent receptor [Kaistia terrae]MCX5580943.1 TonB-dependent receptor [Kaistia terrae]
MAGTAAALLSAFSANAAKAQAAATPAASTTETDEELKKKAAKGETSFLAPITVSAAPEGWKNPFTTPASISSAGADEIQLFGQRNIGNVLRAMPGTFSRDSVQNAGLSVNIRGFEGSGRVNTMIDGVRQNFRFTGHEAQGFTYVDPALVAGVDVQRGAVSTAGGAGALAGTANMRTLGVDDIITDGKNWGALATLTWGSNEVGFSEMAAGALRSTGGGAAIAGAISYSSPNDFENGDGITVPFTGQNLVSGLIKGEFAPTDDLTVKVGAVLYDNDFFANSYFQNVKSNTYTAGLNWDPDSELVNVAAHVYYNDVTMTYDGNVSGAGASAGRVMEDKGYGFDISNTSNFALGQVGVKSIYGFEYFRDDVTAYNVRTPLSGGGVNPSGESYNAGAFSETTFSYNIVDVIAGLRYDFYNLDGSYNAQLGNPLNIPIGFHDVDNSGGRINPKLTIALNPYEWLQPYVTYSESTRPPTISETMLGGSHPGGGVNAYPNPFLVPEIQKGWEIGTNIRRDNVLTENDSLRIKANYYYQNIEDYIVGQFAGRGFYFANQPGTSVVQGFEFESTYDAGVAFASFNYGYTHTDLPTQVAGAGAPMQMPEHVATLTGGARFLEQRLTVGGRLSYVGSAYGGNDVVASNPTDWDAYTLVDVFTNYNFDNGLSLSGNITNLFDKAYTPALSNVTNFTGETGRGRTFLLTAKMQF